MDEKIRQKILQAIGEKTFPGCVVGLVRKNGERTVVPAGQFTYETDSPSVQSDTVFDVASITKAIPTSSLALKLIDDGRLKVGDKLIDFVPEFRNSWRGEALIKHLLAQTLDYGFRLSAHKNKTPEEVLDVIMTSELKSRPGTKFFYANATSILLGLVVERVFGEPLDKLGEKYFFQPLKMDRTTFKPLGKFSKNEIAPTEIQPGHGLLQGVVHDESARVLGQKMVPGSAGLFSTVPDLLNFLEMLLHGGSTNGRKYFSPEIIEQIQTNQIAYLNDAPSAEASSAGLGWELNQPRYMGNRASAKTFGKTGFTGCVVVCDIEREVAFVILSNYTYPHRKSDAGAINQLRRSVADIVLASPAA